MKIDTLDGLNDTELQAVIARSQELLKGRDDARKAKAMNDARTLLASVGLSLKSLNGKGSVRSAKSAQYKGGHRYQHPGDKSLVWNARGQKPGWLRELEAQGGKAVEAANDNTPISLKKTG
jgi:hypothetical protein